MTQSSQIEPPARRRRTQAQRTAETRKALVDAAIHTIYKLGYAGATSALIAEAAGVSSGSIVHHFGTRAELMAEVVRVVFDQDQASYRQLEQSLHVGSRLADWPELMWQVLRRPSGMAMLEILLATRNDAKLAERIAPLYAALEQQYVSLALARLPGSDKSDVLTLARLMVWAIRGLTLAQVIVADPGTIDQSVLMLRRLLERSGDVAVLQPGAAQPCANPGPNSSTD